MKQDLTKIPIQRAWGLVAMADRINDGHYIKFAQYCEGPDGQPTDQIKYLANRTLISNSVRANDPAVTDEDMEAGQRMSEHFQGLALTALSGEISDFDRAIFRLAQQDDITLETEMPYLACLGSRYRREVMREKIQEKIQHIGRSSLYQGTVGNSIERDVQVLSAYAGRTFPGSVVRATDGQNLYFWTTARLVHEWPLDRNIAIRGTVKAHNLDQHQQQETRLTRVKILK